jgi:hypothetical protein
LVVEINHRRREKYLFDDPGFERLSAVRYSEVKERLIRPENLLMALHLKPETTTEEREGN